MNITVAVFTAMAALSGCGTASVVDDAEPAPRRSSAQATLIGRAATALDLAFTAEYEWSEGPTVTMWAAEDGTWRVDVPEWALDGKVDVTLAWTTGGFFQCAEDECVKLAGMTGSIPSEFDPKVQRPFTEWLPLLLDRHLPFEVSREGDCFELTPNTVVVDTPFPAGEWCLDEAGTILSVEAGQMGTLSLVGEAEAPVDTVELPGEVVDGEPLRHKEPDPPTPSPSGSGSPGPSQSPSQDGSPEPSQSPSPTPSPTSSEQSSPPSSEPTESGDVG